MSGFDIRDCIAFSLLHGGIELAGENEVCTPVSQRRGPFLLENGLKRV